MSYNIGTHKIIFSMFDDKHFFKTINYYVDMSIWVPDDPNIIDIFYTLIQQNLKNFILYSVLTKNLTYFIKMFSIYLKCYRNS